MKTSLCRPLLQNTSQTDLLTYLLPQDIFENLCINLGLRLKLRISFRRIKIILLHDQILRQELVYIVDKFECNLDSFQFNLRFQFLYKVTKQVQPDVQAIHKYIEQFMKIMKEQIYALICNYCEVYLNKSLYSHNPQTIMYHLHMAFSRTLLYT